MQHFTVIFSCVGCKEKILKKIVLHNLLFISWLLTAFGSIELIYSFFAKTLSIHWASPLLLLIIVNKSVVMGGIL
jgi:hypothetical protein